MAYSPRNPNGSATSANSSPVVIASDQSPVPVSGTVDLGATDNAVLDAIAASVAAIDTDATTIIGHVDGIETAIGTTNTTLTTIDGRVDGLETSNTAIQTAVELIDDTVATLGTTTYTEATTKGLIVGAVRRDANTSLANTTNEVTPLQVNATGELKTAVIQPLPAGTNNIGDVDIVSGTITTVTNITNQGQIVDDAGATLGTTRAFAIGGIAVQTDGTDPLAVSAEGDAALVRTDMNRILLVNQTHPRFWHVSADYASAQTNTSVKASPGASLSLYITDIQVSNGATAGNVTLLDGSGGTVLYEVYPAINGGATLSLRSPIKLTAATALCITSTSVTTHSLFVSGYIAP
jgi:hypothetical protein